VNEFVYEKQAAAEVWGGGNDVNCITSVIASISYWQCGLSDEIILKRK
jgi:hypothetical protein